MKCNNCGMENSVGTRYCSYCGNKIQNNNLQGNNSSNNNNGDAPLILGIISIALFIFGLRLVAIITSTIGLIMAIRSEDNNNRTVSIVMNGLVLGLSLIMLILLVILVIFLSINLGDVWGDTKEHYNDDYQDDYEYVEKINGTYNCHTYDSDKYVKIITIDDDTIKIEDYDNPLGTYLSGPYNTEYVSYSGNVYQLKVNVKEKYENGDEIPSDYRMNIDMTFSDEKVDVSIDYVDDYRCDIAHNGI